MNRNTIKLLAIAAMTIDHIAFMFVPQNTALYFIMRLFGRMTAPIMSFMLAEGYRYTRSRPKYLLRLSAFALISQPFYFRMLFGRAPANVLEYLTHWNVMFTLDRVAVARAAGIQNTDRAVFDPRGRVHLVRTVWRLVVHDSGLGDYLLCVP